MEIRVLKYFLAVAREGSITGAANSLHLTQPTLTRQLQELEKELRQKLLIRGKHKVTLTLEGMILRKRAEEIVDMVEKTKAEFLAISGTTGGNVYIGGGAPISVQSMCNTKTADVENTIKQIIVNPKITGELNDRRIFLPLLLIRFLPYYRIF